MLFTLISILYLMAPEHKAYAKEPRLKEQVLCDKYVLKTPEIIKFTEPESLLICGDPNREAWSKIPSNQAIYNMKNFFQDRGFFRPKFDEKDGKVYVDVGEKSEIKTFGVFWKGGSPDVGIPDNMRRVRGETLTPKQLDSTRERVGRMLESNAYPCPDVKMQADALDGSVYADITLGPRQNILRVNEEPIEGLVPGVLSRYQAFQVGDPYNADYLQVSTNRMMDEGVVQSAHYTKVCEKDGTALTLRSVTGPPRLFTIGFGVDTEEGPIVRAGWKNARLFDAGSPITVAARASFRRQRFSADLKWYFLPRASRFYFQPDFLVERSNYPNADQITGKVRAGPGVTWDGRHLGAELSVKLAGTTTHTIRGEGPRHQTLMSLNSNLHLMSHYFEFYRGNPTSGFDMRLETDFAQKNVLSPLTAQLVRMSFQNNWNVGSYYPPFLILSLRGQAGVTLTPEQLSDANNQLTTNFRHFMGGSYSLRGFGPNELPDDKGALTVLYGGFEARLPDLLPFGFQPLAFIDAGMLGRQSAEFEKKVYWSPGIGLRWQSPIGVFRGTTAHAFEQRPHPQFYLSFGEEF